MLKGTLAATLAALILAAAAAASAPPVGMLPKGPVQTIQAARGTLVAVALPHHSGGLVWRQANVVNVRVLREVSETTLANQDVVILFKAVGRGSTSVLYGLTHGETTGAKASLTFNVTVS